jgi:hypothetical protein
MKKTYIQPQTIVFSIKIKGNLLTTSTVRVSTESYDEGNMTDLSRRNSLWDDNEE